MLNVTRLIFALLVLAVAAVPSVADPVVIAPIWSSESCACISVIRALPKCGEGCMTFTTCSAATDLSERVCKDCIADLFDLGPCVEECIVPVSHEIGYCIP